jgi:CubicO group peptidase (beta-lactamase class C family)
MMLDGGTLKGARILSPTTIKLMASDHLGQRPSDTFSPGGITFGVEGYTFGLGFMIRRNVGLSGIPGSQGEYSGPVRPQ